MFFISQPPIENVSLSLSLSLSQPYQFGFGFIYAVCMFVVVFFFCLIEAHYVCSECYSEFIKSVTLVWKEDRRDLPYCSKESWVKCPQCRSTSLLSELADNVDHSIDKMLYQCLLKKHFTSKCIHSSCNFETEDVYLMPSHIVKCSASKHAQCQYCDQQVAYTDVSILADVMNIHIKNNCRGLKCIIRQCRSSNTLYTYGELERHLAIHEERRNMRDHLLRAVRDVSNWAEDHRNINMSTSLGTVNDIPYLVTALRSFWRNTRAGHDSSPPLPSVFLQNIIDANQLVDVRRPLSPHSRGLSYANAMDRIIYGNPSFRLDPESEPEQEEADPDSPIILDD